MYQCAKCLRHFKGLVGFDDHHVGGYPPADAQGHYAPGKFVCLSDAELEAKGMFYRAELNMWFREHMPEEKRAQLEAHRARTSPGHVESSDE